MLAVLDDPLRANYVTVSSALNRVAKLTADRGAGGLVTTKERKCLEMMLKVTEELVASGVVNARNLAQLLWSLAKIGNPETRYGDLWRHTDKALQGKGSSKPGTGRSDKNKRGRLPALLANRLSEKACECKPVELAMAAWGLAMLGERNEACLSAIAREVSLRAKEFQGQELGNVVWAFAVLDFREKEMLEAVAEVLSPEPLEWRGRVRWEWKESRVGRNGESGTWKASIDRSWSSGDESAADRPAAELAAVAAAAAAAAAAEYNTSTGGAEDESAGQDDESRKRLRVGSSYPGGGEANGVGQVESARVIGGGVPRSTGDPPPAGRARLLIARDSPSAVAAAASIPPSADAAGASWSDAISSRAADSGENDQWRTGRERKREARPTSFSSGSATGIAAEEYQGHRKCAKEVEVASVVLTPQDLALLSWGFSSLAQDWLPGQARLSHCSRKKGVARFVLLSARFTPIFGE
ncbi:unnamed protein product [Ascophyllum nodosum]